MRVKVCGICRPQDAAAATAAGAAYVGVVLAPGLVRSRTQTQARAIFEASTAQRVGVFVDADDRVVAAAIESLALDVVQLHGSESPERVSRARAAGAAVWKAVRVRSASDVAEAAARYGGGADALLLDGWSASLPGGAGVRFDWEAVATARAALPSGLTVVIAGGLTPDNVPEAVRLLAPDVVDVSSGVESRAGEKSVARIHAFIAAVRGVENLQ